MKVVTSLPDFVHGFRYVKNHHFIELTDNDGNKVTLNAGGIMLGDCKECKAKVAAFENRERMICTHCGGQVTWQWTRPQLAFVPEKESDFKSVPVKKEKP
jgi:hypothetical protein